MDQGRTVPTGDDPQRHPRGRHPLVDHEQRHGRAKIRQAQQRTGKRVGGCRRKVNRCVHLRRPVDVSQTGPDPEIAHPLGILERPGIESGIEQHRRQGGAEDDLRLGDGLAQSVHFAAPDFGEDAPANELGEELLEGFARHGRGGDVLRSRRVGQDGEEVVVGTRRLGRGGGGSVCSVAVGWGGSRIASSTSSTTSSCGATY